MKYIYTKDDGGIVVEMDNGNWDTIAADSPLVASLGAYGGKTEDDYRQALKDAQLESAAESQRQALFREYDTAIMRLKRAERLDDTTATASIAQWDAYAVALQALNDEPGWFRDTVWPTKPKV